MGDEQAKTEPKPERAGAPENPIYIGKKGVMSYVLAVMTQFNQGTRTVCVKARGRSISTAVDVAEVVRNKFLNEVKVKDIRISTEELPNSDGSTSKVSSIEIKLEK